MKKLLTPLFYTFITLSVFACGKSGNQQSGNDTTPEQAKQSINKAMQLAYKADTQVASSTVMPDGTTVLNFAGKTGTASLQKSRPVKVDIEHLSTLKESVKFTASNFSQDGINAIDAQFTIETINVVETNNGNLSITDTAILNGTMTLTGKGSFVFQDLTMKTSAYRIASNTPVLFTLNGSLTIDGTTYTYTNDNFDLTATP